MLHPEVHLGLCVSRGRDMEPPIHPRCDGNHLFALAQTRGTFPKWPICHPVSGSSASIKDICTGLMLLPRQLSHSRAWL